jgi:hypothetical protein
MWPRKRLRIEEPILTNEILNGIIETLMRIDANVQSLVVRRGRG